MQDILAYVRDHRDFTPTARYAAQLAGKFDAALTALYVCRSPVYVAPAYHPELIAAYQENAREVFGGAVQRRPRFVEWAARLGAERAEWLVAQGNPAAVVAQVAQRHDLVVLGRDTDDADAQRELPLIVLKAAAPCLVLPLGSYDHRRIERAAIAWNGSPEAMRAVHSALPFLHGRQVLLMEGEERGDDPDIEWNPQFDIERYLERHGAEVTRAAIAAAPDAVGAELLDEAAHFLADLLVMGAYGRSRFSEWMLGGATRDVLADARLPVLLRH